MIINDSTQVVCIFTNDTLIAHGCLIVIVPTTFNENIYYITAYRRGEELSTTTIINTGLPSGYYTVLLYEIGCSNLPAKFPAFSNSSWLPSTDSIIRTGDNVISSVNMTITGDQMCFSCTIQSQGQGFMTIYHRHENNTQNYNIPTPVLSHVMSRNQLKHQEYCLRVLPGRYTVAVFGIRGNDVSRVDQLPTKTAYIVISKLLSGTSSIYLIYIFHG